MKTEVQKNQIKLSQTETGFYLCTVFNNDDYFNDCHYGIVNLTTELKSQIELCQKKLCELREVLNDKPLCIQLMVDHNETVLFLENVDFDPADDEAQHSQELIDATDTNDAFCINIDPVSLGDNGIEYKDFYVEGTCLVNIFEKHFNFTGQLINTSVELTTTDFSL